MEDFSSRPPSERPLSRRGGSNHSKMTDSSTPSPLSAVRPDTAMRGRPPSALRLGTASRLVAQTGSMNSPGSTGLFIGSTLGHAGNMMADRPITQHGLSGLPTSHVRTSTASGMRQIKDKRFWQGIIQVKIQEIVHETDRLIKESKSIDREKSAKKIYERKVKDAAKELTNLQAKLTDMNIALDSFSSGINRQQLQNETTVLRERNENFQTQLENLFRERQMKEELNKELEQSVETERNKINEMIYSLPLEEQNKYQELQLVSQKLKNENSELHSDIEALVKQKDRLNASIMNNQVRLEALRLQTRLQELIVKRNLLREEELNRLSPAQEREKLINEVRANNQALTSIGRQMKLSEDQLNEKREALLQVEQDLEEGNSERHAKYKELKRRDETMSNFMESFQQNLIAEKQNIENLKNQIAYAIEQITLQGINMKSYGLGKMNLLNEKNDLSSQNGLLKEYKKFDIQLKQLQILEKRTLNQMEANRIEENDLIKDIEKFSNLENLRAEATIKMEELTTILENLKDKQRVTEQVVESTRQRCQDIKEHLKANETYRLISHLEEKLNDLINEKNVLQNSVEQSRKEHDYIEIKEQTMDKLKEVMEMLRENRSTAN